MGCAGNPKKNSISALILYASELIRWFIGLLIYLFVYFRQEGELCTGMDAAEWSAKLQPRIWGPGFMHKWINELQKPILQAQME